jgi:hypothetical protein
MPTLGKPMLVPESGMPASNGQLQTSSSSLPAQAQVTSVGVATSSMTPFPYCYGTPGSTGSPGSLTNQYCPPTRGEQCQTCVREPATRTITHVTYCMIGKAFCVPKCTSCFGTLFGGCTTCEEPRVKYYLVKKVQTEVCPTTKCVPAVAPGYCSSAIPPSR